MKKGNEKGTYWYKFVIRDCPVCGRDYSYKIRVYNFEQPKPDNIRDQYSWEYHYDYCNSL